MLPDPTSPEAIGLFIGTAAAAAVALNQIDDFLERRKAKPGLPPNEQIQAALDAMETRVTKLEENHAELIAKMETDSKDIATKMEAMKSEVLRAGAERGRRIYDEIKQTKHDLNQASNEMHELKGEMKAFTTSVATLTQGIQALQANILKSK